jgi:hypothetical protein
MATAVIDLEPSENETESEEIPRGGSASQRSLGMEIILSAVTDYRHGSAKARASAEAFLFPAHPDYRHQFNLVTLIANVDPRFLPESLERARPEWDREWQCGETDDSKEDKEAA